MFDTYKERAIEEYVKQNIEDRFIFVYKYKVDEQVINDMCKLLNIDAVVLHNSQSEAQNLQEYNHIIFYSPSFSYKDLVQMKARIMRIGQVYTPKFTTFIRKNTIEEYIVKRVDNKDRNFNKLRDFKEFEEWQHQRVN